MPRRWFRALAQQEQVGAAGDVSLSVILSSISSRHAERSAWTLRTLTAMLRNARSRRRTRSSTGRLAACFHSRMFPQPRVQHAGLSCKMMLALPSRGHASPPRFECWRLLLLLARATSPHGRLRACLCVCLPVCGMHESFAPSTHVWCDGALCVALRSRSPRLRLAPPPCALASSRSIFSELRGTI